MIATRRLTVADWQANRAIRIEAVAANPGLYFTTLAELEARSDDAWRAMLENPDLAIFGLYDGDLLVGVTAAYVDRDADPTGRTAGLAMSYIRPAWRGRGLTSLLYAPRLDWAREQGCARIHVTHRASNIPSMRAILRHGFVLTGREVHLWPDGEEEENCRYELML
ncbi:GNAT family N-acetyltransferase [Sphingomonas sp. G-3-2-10]|uniref:GNAT family N-acetyltransferase n=1 Tax=Sphingomonas sp. G-3-2-10 TaxID=2728838 RepID=UPI00146BCDC4|nr:GNAT family N-acetyltransferase [Sphingomonas sp. G-3-2-10]NML06158.1 GNAT family N-acetyltransferase [Sphingomonas sp. G-3-2-10]